MPTQTYSLPNAAVVFSGQWNDATAGGHNARNFTGQNTQFDFVATGTALTLLANYPGSVTITASIDGGAFTNLTATGGAWASVSVFTGLADAPHTVTIKHTAGSQSNFYLDRDTALTLTGASPALAAPSGFGPQYLLNDAAVLAKTSQEGNWNAQAVAGYASPTLQTTNWPDVSVRFRAQCGVVKVWMFQDGSKLRCQLDGSDGALVTTANTGQYGWVTLFTGLDPSAAHDVGFTVAYTPGTSYVYALMCVGGAGLLNAAITARPLAAYYGDSITLGFAGTGNDASAAYPHLLSGFEGWAVANRGLGGSTVLASGQTRTADITGLTPSPAVVVIGYGTNDLAQVSGAETVAQFTTAYTAMMNTLAAALPAARFLCLGILPRKDFTALQRAPWSAAIQSVVTTLARNNVTFASTEGWISDASGSPDLFDNVHPNAVGYGKVVAQLEPYFNAQPAPEGLFAMSVNVPRNAQALSNFLGNYITVAQANLATLGFTSADIAALTALKSDLDAKVASEIAVKEALKAATKNKSTSYNSAANGLRASVKKVDAQLSVPESLLKQLGLTVRKPKPSIIMPSVPSALVVSGSEKGVNYLKWNANGNVSGTQYIVEAMIGTAPSFQFVDVTTRTDYAHTFQTPGVKVQYRVRAKRSAHVTLYSNMASVYAMPLAA